MRAALLRLARPATDNAMAAAAPIPALSLTLQFSAPSHLSHKAILKRAVVTRWVRTVLFADAELTIRLVDTDEARSLNRSYRARDYATNVLTFTYDSDANDAGGHASHAVAAELPVLADLVLCCAVVEREATEQAVSLEAHYAHLIVHGALHAQGYDHEQEDEAHEMESIETEAMLKLGYQDPYR